MDQLHQHIASLASAVENIFHDDIPALGAILSQVEAIEHHTAGEARNFLSPLIHACKTHIEQLILENTTDTSPLMTAVTDMQTVVDALCQGRTPPAPSTVTVSPEATDEDYSPQQADNGSDATTHPKTGGSTFGEDDIEIVESFVAEAMENLETIEANLVELEEHPGDKSVIDAIFRPFHTIKGVAGFIDLQKISKLAHSTENLLDQARMGVITIDAAVTNLILESVDLLKVLIRRVEEGLSESRRPIDDDIDIDFLVERINDRVATAQMISETRIGSILLEKGTITEDTLYKGLVRQQSTPQKRLGEILVEDRSASTQQISAALDEQKQIRNVARKTHIKVDTEKLDNLIDLTGELVISQSMLRQGIMALNNGNQEMIQTLNQLKQIVGGIQRISMAMRMVPVKHTFQKMRRVVRDVAHKSNKNVALKLSGEETEIDKTVVDALYDPLVHMMRNSVDHGIEPPADRCAAGKPDHGTIRLSAYNKAGNIIIEIEDDGKGLDRDAILRKALSSGMTTKDTADRISDKDVYDMIMQPGFSTAARVSDVSGRGVGMDVVKQAVEKLNGKLNIESTPGQGTRFVISLPLTLAIIDGMLVRVGDEKYIIPTMAISIAFRPGQNDYHTVKGQGEMIQTRTGLMPLLRFDRLFHTSIGCRDPRNGLVVVVESRGEQKCLLIDELLGKEEFVIKNLGDSLKGIDGVAGGAILGDGQVGLILDIEGLFKTHAAS
ncbi:MAG: chemotaxis protein CheA [Thermodesulfobacteriota bacterium]|nr:chemotaxis protein CheA [Thermodesulfobacteriota bacterium]